MRECSASTVVCADPALVQAAADLECALHDLAQPLTVLAFLTELAALQSDAAAWKAALDAGAVESTRAIARLRIARDAAARMNRAGGVIL